MILRAHELRINNIVADGDVIRMVTGIVLSATGEHVFLDGAEVLRPLDNIRPVALSKAVVESCGFEESADGFWYEQVSTTLYPIYLMVINGNWDFSLSDPKEVAFWKRIHWLHELQNLYFALNSKGLEIEL